VYPERNPFPPQATMNLDGMKNFSVEGIPTATGREPLRRLTIMQHRYLDAWTDSGRAVALHGGHGTGKTHTLLYALSQIGLHQTENGRHPVTLYVRADAPDPVVLYRKLMARWSRGALRELAVQAFAGYAAEEFVASRGSTDGPRDELEQVSRRLRDDPELVRHAIQGSELSRTGILNRQEQDISRIQGSFGHFERGLRALFDPNLAKAAHRWLTAESVEPADLERLGVTGPIQDLPDVRIGIHVLATLARRAGRPLTLALDQVEAFLRTSDNAIERGNAGLLRAVVEAVVDEHGLLLAAMSEDAWQDLPPDVRQRFGPSEIPMPALSLGEAEDVLAAYLAPWPPAQEQPRTFPFAPAAVRQLLTESGGNMRRYIQTAHFVFNTALDDKLVIEAPTVMRALARTGGERAPKEAEVRRAVERTLRSRGARVEVDHVRDGREIDFAVLRGDRIVLAVEISAAVFGGDEAARAAEHLETVRALRGDRPVVVLVIVGYSSPEVLEKLEEVADHVIVAATHAFEGELERAVAGALANGATTGVMLDARFDELREELLRVVEQRQSQEQIVEEQLQVVSTSRSLGEWEEAVRSARQAWSQERQRIEDEIHAKRAERRAAELEELMQLHDDAVRRLRESRRTRLMALGAASVLVAALVGVFVGTAQSTTLIGVMSFVVTAIVLAAAIALLYLFGERRWQSMEAPARPRDVEGIRRLAFSRYADVLSPDPYDRYAAVLDRRLPGPDRLLELVRREPSALIRREMVRPLMAMTLPSDPFEVGRIFSAGLDSATLSVAVESAGPDALPDLERLPDRLRLVALLSGVPLDIRSWIEALVGGAVGSHHGASPDPLMRAFDTDDDRDLAAAIAEVRERELRRATALLSPFDDDGLGAYHWLDRIGIVDDLYVFLRKAAFYAAGGLERPPEAVPAP
jgi:hypothetical protein